MIRRRRLLRQTESKCWSCKHSVPCLEDRRGCEWSILGSPVRGWEATKTGTSYRVTNCPKYEPEETVNERITREEGFGRT